MGYIGEREGEEERGGRTREGGRGGEKKGGGGEEREGWERENTKVMPVYRTCTVSPSIYGLVFLSHHTILSPHIHQSLAK